MSRIDAPYCGPSDQTFSFTPLPEAVPDDEGSNNGKFSLFTFGFTTFRCMFHASSLTGMEICNLVDDLSLLVSYKGCLLNNYKAITQEAA